MRVVHVTTIDVGGAYKAVNRINEALLRQGIESSILLRSKTNPKSIGIEVLDNGFKRICSKTKNVGNKLFSRGEFQTDMFGTDITHEDSIISADIIVLHWVNSFLGYEQITKLKALHKPIIWVMHDMWTFTGGCHCDGYCGRYVSGCGKCPILNSKIERDLSYKNVIQKRKVYEDITFVGVSKHNAEMAKKSFALGENAVYWIHNPLDKTIFCPIEALRVKESEERSLLLEYYGIPSEKRIILYGASRAVTDRNKGAQDIEYIFNQDDNDKYHLVVFGNENGSRLRELPIGVTYLGYISEEKELAKIYNICDVFLSLSRQESYGYTVAESLACGTPVVGYEIGGVSEQVVHKRNGYLSKRGDYKGIREGVDYFLSHQMEILDNKNDMDEIGREYIRLFENII